MKGIKSFIIILFAFSFLKNSAQSKNTWVSYKANTNNIISSNIKSGQTDTSNTKIFSKTNDFRLFEEGRENTPYFLIERDKEGYFYYDPADNTSPDDEGTVIVTALGKRYKRLFEGPVNITWFGAKGDGVTDDSNAFIKALSAKSNAIYLSYKQSGYKISNVTVTKTVTLSGDNKFSSKIIPAFNNSSCFISEAEFVEYKNIYFDGAGTANTTGIEHKHRISTVSDCFFSGLNKCIFNNKAFVAGGKPDEQTVSNCRFRNCLYGIYSDGDFINSKITNCIFHGCTKSAIFCFDDSYNASVSTTEGLTIEGCLIYDCGNRAENTAAIELKNVDFSFIRNCMVDLNNHTAFSLTNSQNCNISGTYFSAAASVDASAVTIKGNCSNTTFDRCQFYDAKRWGFELLGLEARISDNIRISNCSGRLNKKGDFFISGGTNVWINNSNFFSNTSSDVQVSSSSGDISLYIRATNIIGAVLKTDEAAIVDIKDCPDKPTLKVGMVTIHNGEQFVTVLHGLTVLAGQKVFVFANNTTISEAVSASVTGNEIKIARAGKTGEAVINYRAEVQ